MKLEDIIKVIEQTGKIAILPHVSADGDAVGSSLALCRALLNSGREASVYLEEQVPFIYSFLPDINLIREYNDAAADYNIAIALDTGDRERLGKRAGMFDSAAVKVNIDHHNTNTRFGDWNYVDTKASATGEIIYDILKLLKIEITPGMAACLYAAIATDTGGFRYSNTTSLTHRITAELMEKGIDAAGISRRVFDTISYEKVKLMGSAIEKIELFENGQAAMIILTDEMMNQAGASDEDCDGIVNLARNIRGVEVAVALRSRSDGTVKANLRSRAFVDVSKIASGFGGGGHIRAAGFTASQPLDEITSQIKMSIRKALVE